LAVTAAFSPYPQTSFGTVRLDRNTGLLWTTESTTRSLASDASPLTYFSNLKLANPAQAAAMANTFGNKWPGPGEPTPVPFLRSWQQIGLDDGNFVRNNNEERVLLVGSWLLAVLAVASVAVLVGGRMADQMRRVGLLKAIGSSSGLVASVLMAEYLVVALAGAGVGLMAGRLFAPVLTAPAEGLLGVAPTPPFSPSTALAVIVVALGVVFVATLVPALRAAHTNTMRALAESARAPRRSALLLALSTSLPVPLLIAIRVMARRLRRTALSVLSIFVTVSGIVAVLIAHERLGRTQSAGTSGLIDPRIQRVDQVLLVVTLMLIALAAVNAIFITRANAQDTRRVTAVTRALGATPRQVAVGLSAAQALPAFLGALLGVLGGFGLYDAAKTGGDAATFPPFMLLLAVIMGSVGAIALLTAIPARWGARRPVAAILQTELI
jgi:putative ABC transport system permease protein